MNPHVPDDLLRAFVDAEVDEAVAVHVADHLDACAHCATRAAALEPLAVAFAAVVDPLPPPELVARILARVERVERVPAVFSATTLQIGGGVALLAAAALLTIGVGSPSALASDLSIAATALASLGRGLAVGLGSYQFALAATTALTLVGGLVTLRIAALPEPELDAAARRSS